MSFSFGHVQHWIRTTHHHEFLQIMAFSRENYPSQGQVRHRLVCNATYSNIVFWHSYLAFHHSFIEIFWSFGYFPQHVLQAHHSLFRNPFQHFLTFCHASNAGSRFGNRHIIIIIIVFTHQQLIHTHRYDSNVFHIRNSYNLFWGLFDFSPIHRDDHWRIRSWNSSTGSQLQPYHHFRPPFNTPDPNNLEIPQADQAHVIYLLNSFPMLKTQSIQYLMVFFLTQLPRPTMSALLVCSYQNTRNHGSSLDCVLVSIPFPTRTAQYSEFPQTLNPEVISSYSSKAFNQPPVPLTPALDQEEITRIPHEESW